MRTICLINNKGGVAKTTTAINLAAGLSRKDRKVLLIDLDPQSNVDLSLQGGAEYTILDVLTGKIGLNEAIVNLGTNFDLIAAEAHLNQAEQEIGRNPNPKQFLKRTLDNIDGYDYVIIDCPPSMGLLSQNVLQFCQEAFIPTSTDFLGFDALNRMYKIIEKASNEGSDIKVTKVIPTLFDRRNKICKQTLADIQNEYPEVCSHPIRINSKLKEAPKYGKGIFKHARSSPGAKDYGQLVEDVLAMEAVASARQRS